LRAGEAVSAEKYGHRLALCHLPSIPSYAHCLSCGVATAFSHPRTHPLAAPRHVSHKRGWFSHSQTPPAARDMPAHTRRRSPRAISINKVRETTRALPRSPPSIPSHDTKGGGVVRAGECRGKGCRFPGQRFLSPLSRQRGGPKRIQTREKSLPTCVLSIKQPPNSRKPKPRAKGPHLPAHHERTRQAQKPSWVNFFLS